MSDAPETTGNLSPAIPFAADTSFDGPIHGPAPKLRQLHPNTRLAWRIGYLISAGIFLLLTVVFVVIAVFARGSFGWLLTILPGLLTLLLLWSAVVYARWYYDAYRYAVRERDVLVYSGVWWRLIKCVPRARIQHVDIESGPIDRAFGLAKLSLFTAGTVMAVIVIPGIAPDEAERLRGELLGLTRTAEPAHASIASRNDSD